MKKHLVIATFLGILAVPRAASAAEPCESGASLEVATLNTWGLPYPLSKRRTSRFARIGKYLRSGLDVVGLQEVWKGARGLLLHDLRLPTEDADSGLAMVTHLPSTRPVLEPFEEARGPDRWKSKGVLRARIQPDEGEPTWVVVTHMQAGHGEKAAAVRASQIDQLLGVVEDLDGPAVVMGDFNLYDDLFDDRQSVDRLVDAGLVDASVETGGAGPTYPGSQDRLDRIYLRSTDQTGLAPLETRVGKARGLSDHRPVEATVRLCQPQELARLTAPDRR